MTRSCPECGAPAQEEEEEEEEEAFCGECGTYLEWDDAAGPAPVRAQDAAPVETAAEPSAGGPAPLWRQVTEQARRVIDRPAESDGELPEASRAIIDTDPTIFWAPAGDPRGESVIARFSEPQRLVHLLLSPGASVSKKGRRVAVGRPRTVVVVLHRSEGEDETETVELADEVGTAQVDLGVSDVEAVTLRLRRAYPGQSQDLVALGEVEFFVRP